MLLRTAGNFFRCYILSRLRHSVVKCCSRIALYLRQFHRAGLRRHGFMQKSRYYWLVLGPTIAIDTSRPISRHIGRTALQTASRTSHT